MTPSSQIGREFAPARVSIIARVVPVFSFSMPMFGAALCALLLMRVLEAMRNAESAGVGAVAGGMAEANLAITLALFCGAIVGLAAIGVTAIRAFTTTMTASPSAFFFLISGILAALPLVFLWEAQSVFLEGLRGGNISLVASSLLLFLRLTIISAAILTPILLIASLIPLPSFLRARHKWAPLVLLILIEFAMIGTGVILQMRTSWLYRASEMEQF